MSARVNVLPQRLRAPRGSRRGARALRRRRPVSLAGRDQAAIQRRERARIARERRGQRLARRRRGRARRASELRRARIVGLLGQRRRAPASSGMPDSVSVASWRVVSASSARAGAVKASSTRRTAGSTAVGVRPSARNWSRSRARCRPRARPRRVRPSASTASQRNDGRLDTRVRSAFARDAHELGERRRRRPRASARRRRAGCADACDAAASRSAISSAPSWISRRIASSTSSSSYSPVRPAVAGVVARRAARRGSCSCGGAASPICVTSARSASVGGAARRHAGHSVRTSRCASTPSRLDDEQVRLDAHVGEARDRARRVVGVQRREHEVAGRATPAPRSARSRGRGSRRS